MGAKTTLKMLLCYVYDLSDNVKLYVLWKSSPWKSKMGE
jgi:hypothetical protein